MTSEESMDLQELFEEASQLEGHERSAFIEALRDRSPSLARDVEELLEVEAEGGPLADDLGPSHAARLYAQARSSAGHVEPATIDESIDPFLKRVSSDAPTKTRYIIKGEIARGGMGTILRVWDQDLRRNLAMKVILGEGESRRTGHTPEVHSRSLSRFLQEAQVTGQLDHPGIVPVHDLGVDDVGRDSPVGRE